MPPILPAVPPARHSPFSPSVLLSVRRRRRFSFFVPARSPSCPEASAAPSRVTPWHEDLRLPRQLIYTQTRARVTPTGAARTPKPRVRDACARSVHSDATGEMCIPASSARESPSTVDRIQSVIVVPPRCFSRRLQRDLSGNWDSRLPPLPPPPRR